jgi:EAL domain-containing protein (putative c-di-GMP-specific phosphodiesterase class I)
VGGQVIGFEALLRGPPGPLQAPLPLLAAAHARGRGGELDWVGRAAAFQAMLDTKLPPTVSLFVNVDPESLLEPCPDDLLDVIWAAQSGLRVFVEITETMLLREPVRVLRSVRRARGDGWGIALDNVGYGATGLALLPVIEPDVIKLDRQLLAEGTGHASAALMAASRERLRTGASLLVERFEDDATVPLSHALGIGFRQGRVLAVEGPLPERLPIPRRPVPLLKHAVASGRSPWDVLVDHGAHLSQTNSETGVSNIVRHLVSAAFAGQEAPVVALIRPRGQLRDDQSASVFRMLLERSPLQIILGPDASLQDGWRAWGVDLPAFHPFSRTLTIVAVSSTSAVSLAARPLSESPDENRHELVLSHHLGAALAVLREILDLCEERSGFD